MGDYTPLENRKAKLKRQLFDKRLTEAIKIFIRIVIFYLHLKFTVVISQVLARLPTKIKFNF